MAARILVGGVFAVYARIWGTVNNRTDALADMISQGLGYSVLTREFADHYVKHKKLCILNNNKTYQHP